MRSATEIASHVEQRKTDQRVFAVLETLEFLHRGGRIGRTAAFLGSAARICVWGMMRFLKSDWERSLSVLVTK